MKQVAKTKSCVDSRDYFPKRFDRDEVGRRNTLQSTRLFSFRTEKEKGTKFGGELKAVPNIASTGRGRARYDF